jgi:transcriptional regulator with XRE-family HTH domain/tetratricopeptide (TPR) repeat protein
MFCQLGFYFDEIIVGWTVVAVPMDENIGSLGYWIKRRRKALDLTRAGLAARVNCSSDTIKKIERDERRPSLQIAGLLADALELSPKERAQFLETAEKKRSPENLPLSANAFLSLPRLTHPLPSQTTPFIGRQTELVELTSRLCDPECRLVTLVGPGGIGKTRLALQAAEHLQADYREGAGFVTLAGIDSSGDIPAAITTSLGLSQLGKDGSEEQLVSFLQNKELLLLLDNYEHLLPDTGLLTSILEKAPGVKLLVTSRQRLNLISEWVYAIEGLSIPVNGVSDLETYSSAALFVVTARRLKPDFRLDESNKSAVAQICRQVEGMPLAIELAAAWIPVLDPQGIAEGITQGLDILEADMGDMPERQRSMRAVFDVSWNLLSELEQQVVQQLAVFRGGFSQMSAEAAFGISTRQILGLVNKCWLRQESNGRFGLHELVRQYAEQRALVQPGLWVSIRESHSLIFCNLLKSHQGEWFSHKEKTFVAQIEADFQNIEAAWSWAIENCRADYIGRAIESLCIYLDRSGRIRKGKAVAKAAVDCLAAGSSDLFYPPDSLSLARALYWLTDFSEEREEKNRLIEEANLLLDRLEQSGCDTQAERARFLWVKSVLCYRESPQLSLELISQAAQLFRAVGEKTREVMVYGSMVDLCLIFGYVDQAAEVAYRSLSISKELGNQWLVVASYESVGDVCRQRGDLEQAERYHCLSVVDEQEMGFQTVNDINLTETLILAGKFDEATQRAEAQLISVEMIESSSYRASLASLQLARALMHSGEFSRARLLGEMSLQEGEKDNKNSRIKALNLLAQLDVVEEQTDAALARLQESLEALKGYRQVIFASTPLTVLSYVFLRREQIDQADEHLRASLQEAARIGSFPLAVKALPALALLETAHGKYERAIEIYSLALKYPYISKSKWFEDIAGCQIASIEAALPPETVSAARSRGRELDLWEVVREWSQR